MIADRRLTEGRNSQFETRETSPPNLQFPRFDFWFLAIGNRQSKIVNP
jgi:hypothetical protein